VEYRSLNHKSKIIFKSKRNWEKLIDGSDVKIKKNWEKNFVMIHSREIMVSKLIKCIDCFGMHEKINRESFRVYQLYKRLSWDCLGELSDSYFITYDIYQFHFKFNGHATSV
jgi:hypothetical protein